ncbi:MAG TPA: DNA-binding response regulator [Firmicutes bacterium]|jgi:two-component system, response regulator YesN|nr:DNA-binding response regulator [Bacillota bacterium]
MGNELMIKVVVAEDEELILNHIIKKIQAVDSDFLIVGAAQNGKQALEMVEEFSPDIIVTDIRMPVIDGLELLKNVSLNYPYIKTIVVSGYSDFEYAKQAIQYGVREYLLKPLESEELHKALAKIKISLEAEMNFLGHKIVKTAPGNTSPKEVAAIILQFIRENFAQEINLNSLAKNFNFNASYLSKLFKKYYAETPVRYLLNLRIHEAKHLLRSQPELGIKAIGELVGYPDPFYFSRIFKHITGKSPSEFREQ